MQHDAGAHDQADVVRRLDEAEGADFDRTWLQLMLEHHRGAVEMARTEQAEGSDEEALALAEEIEQSQTREVTEMQALLG